MTRNAERVHTDQAELDRLGQLIEQLPNGAHVVLRMEDGDAIEGIVAARPIAQVFFGPDGEEGTNAVLRLEQPALYRPEAAGWRDVWVDRIQAVRRLDPE
ncbi:DUF3247 family protein [Lysobacter sp. F6437]|uniref:DUF3247 family protein n=1 Tax=Lysobacter sp. F6437 TaxID=3459296 RepID=UPI00403DBE72